VPKKNVWTVPHPDGGWANKLEGSSRLLNRAPTKREAQALGRERAMQDKVEHIIQNKDGQIGQRNSYGRDPSQRAGLDTLTLRLHANARTAGVVLPTAVAASTTVVMARARARRRLRGNCSAHAARAGSTQRRKGGCRRPTPSRLEAGVAAPERHHPRTPLGERVQRVAWRVCSSLGGAAAPERARFARTIAPHLRVRPR